MQDEAATRAGRLAGFAAAGLTPDLACMDLAQAPDPDRCLTWEEYDLLHPEPYGESTLCGECSFASGDRQVGEPCTELDSYGHPSDCAPGLLCFAQRTPSGICIDPCAPAAEGLPCDSYINRCDDGLTCTRDRVCKPAARPGESCEDVLCLDGYTCQGEQQICVPFAGPGESCEDIFCDWDAGLVCAADDRCRPLPQLGEPCNGTCVDGLICQPGTNVCAPLGDVGAPCEGPHHCAVELQCEAMTCQPRGELGEPCTNGDAPCRLGLSCIDEVCGPGQGLLCATP